MRHVISKQEVAAAWVAQDRDNARTATNNFWFHSFSELVSYSTVIASRVLDINDEDIIFVTTNNYSAATNAQLSVLNDTLRRSNHTTKIWVPYRCPVSTLCMPGVWKELADSATALWKKAQRARQNKPYLIQQGNEQVSQANMLVDLFGEDVTKGIKAETIEHMQEELRVNEAFLALRA